MNTSPIRSVARRTMAVIAALCVVAGVSSCGADESPASSPSTEDTPTGSTIDPVTDPEEDTMDDVDLVGVYRLDYPDDFDPRADTERFAAVFDVDGQVGAIRDDDTSVSIGNAFDGEATMGIDLQVGSWGFVSAAENTDGCRDCGPVTISEDDAIAATQTILDELGYDVGDFEWSATTVGADEGIRDESVVTVYAQRNLDGRPFGDSFRATFGNGEQLLFMSGSVWEPILRGEVPLLTPAEALAQESTELAFDVPVESLDANLVWAVSFDRSEVEAFMVPMYQFPIDNELGLDNDVLAIHRDDIPTD